MADGLTLAIRTLFATQKFIYFFQIRDAEQPPFKTVIYYLPNIAMKIIFKSKTGFSFCFWLL